MRNPNDDSLLTRYYLCVVFQGILTRGSRYTFPFWEFALESLSCELFCQIILVPAMQENAGFDGFIFSTLGISLRETAREN